MKKHKAFIYVIDGVNKKAPFHVGKSSCPILSLEESKREKSIDEYSQDAQKIIKLISVNDNLEPVGSSKYVVHKYPSDIDLFEPIKGCCTLNKVRMSISNSIQNVIKNIEKEENVYFSRFQAGYDRRYDIYIGMEKNGVVIDYEYKLVIREIENLYNQKLLSDVQYKKVKNLVKPLPTVREFLSLYYFFKNLMMIDWSVDEILQGYKTLQGNKKMFLDSALVDKSLVKLDIWAELPYDDLSTSKRYIEITNWFLIQVEDINGNLETLSIVQDDRKSSLRTDIYKYMSPRYNDLLKASKRFWNYLNEYYPEDKYIIKLSDMFFSYIAFLNSIKTDMELQIKMLKMKLITEDYYKKFIRCVKYRLENLFPSCYFDNNFNILLLKSLSKNKNVIFLIQEEISKLTEKYIFDHKIEIIKFIEQN